MTFQTICMWSGPRNLSTAMMRSFENRADTAVWDEPFFAPWLASTGKDHPGRAETLERHETDPDKVAQSCLTAPSGGQAYYFQKQMPHHVEDHGWMMELEIKMLMKKLYILTLCLLRKLLSRMGSKGIS